MGVFFFVYSSDLRSIASKLANGSNTCQLVFFHKISTFAFSQNSVCTYACDFYVQCVCGSSQKIKNTQPRPQKEWEAAGSSYSATHTPTYSDPYT